MAEDHPTGIVSATGIAVGRADAEQTPAGADLEDRMHEAVKAGQALGESDEQIKARIDAVIRG
jgi:hypothetical protein